jgi:hypothetical protein
MGWTEKDRKAEPNRAKEKINGNKGMNKTPWGPACREITYKLLKSKDWC